jgi:predicted porin
LGGRQYTVAHDVLSRFEALGFANNAILGYQDANYTGLRYDNTLKYLKAWGPLSVEAAHSFGEVAGSNAGSADGVGAVYVVGDLTVGASYQETKNVTSAYFGAVAAAQASKQKVFGGGLTYQWNASRLYAGYTDSKLDVADYKNRVYYLGVNHQATSSLQIVASVQGDKEDHAGGTGNRITSTLLVDYFLDKATDVYAEVDYTKVKDGWIALANNTALGTGNMFGKDKRSGVMLGLRLKF